MVGEMNLSHEQTLAELTLLIQCIALLPFRNARGPLRARLWTANLWQNSLHPVSQIGAPLTQIDDELVFAKISLEPRFWALLGPWKMLLDLKQFEEKRFHKTPLFTIIVEVAATNQAGEMAFPPLCADLVSLVKGGAKIRMSKKNKMTFDRIPIGAFGPCPDNIVKARHQDFELRSEFIDDESFDAMEVVDQNF